MAVPIIAAIVGAAARSVGAVARTGVKAGVGAKVSASAAARSKIKSHSAVNGNGCGLEVVEDRSELVEAAIRDLKKRAVYVGIRSGSKRSDGAPDNNALGWIHEKGSPAANIPARPFLKPGVASDKDYTARKFKGAAKAAFAGDSASMDKLLEQAGDHASDAVRAYVRKGIAPPLAPSTLRNRHRQRQTKSRRKSEISGAGNTPLINTATLVKAVHGYLDKGKGISNG